MSKKNKRAEIQPDHDLLSNQKKTISNFKKRRKKHFPVKFLKLFRKDAYEDEIIFPRRKVAQPVEVEKKERPQESRKTLSL